MAPRPVTIHSCIHRVSIRCASGTGKPTRKACPGCGGSFVLHTGLWGVFTWRGDGRYPMEEAHSLHRSQEKAGEAASNELVVRWVPVS